MERSRTRTTTRSILHRARHYIVSSADVAAKLSKIKDCSEIMQFRGMLASLLQTKHRFYSFGVVPEV